MARAILTIIFSAATLWGCADEKPKAKIGTNGSTGTNTSITTSEDLCTTLKANAIASSARFADFVTELCDGTLLTQLRSGTYAYTDATTTPNLYSKASPVGKTSNLRIWASSVPATDAKSYYNYMRLQIGSQMTLMVSLRLI